MKMEILLLNTVIMAPRNSLSEDLLYFTIGELGIYSCGKWIEYEGDLIKYKRFCFERAGY